MIVRYSKSFEKSVRKLSGKALESVKSMIVEVISAKSLNDITDCKKLSGFDTVYRIRTGDMRALFLLMVMQDINTKDKTEKIVVFEYLVPGGQAYSKKINEQLRQLDK